MKSYRSLLTIAGLTLAFCIPTYACGDHAAMLKKYDANGDGKLDDTEKAALKADRKAKCEARKAEMLKKYDANGDGTLDDTEKATMKAACKANHGECKKHHDDSDKSQPKSDSGKDSSKPDTTHVPPVF